MIKRLLQIMVGMFTLSLLLTGCKMTAVFENMDLKTLRIDSTEIQSSNTGLSSLENKNKTMMISLVDVLTHYGFCFKWHSDTKAEITNGSLTYILNTEEPALCSTGDPSNILTIYSHVYDYHYQARTRDVVLSTVALEYVASELGITLFARSFENDQKAYILTRLTAEESCQYNVVMNGVRTHLDGVFTYPDESGASVYPLVEILTLCGFDVKWNSDVKATVKCGLKKYVISLYDSTVKYLGKEIDLGLAGGNPQSWYQKTQDGDLYCSSFIVRALIAHMGQPVFLFDLDDATYIIIKQ